MPARRFVLLAVLGAVVGTLGDQIHVQFNVLSYPHPFPGLHGQAWWVPLLFAGAGVALVQGHATFLSASAPRAPSPWPLVTSSLWFIAAYFSTGLLQDHPRALAAALAALWAARVALAPTADKIAAGVAYAVSGSLFEAALSSTGAFHYRNPDLLLVPCWLPALYLHVSLMTREIHRTLLLSHRARAAAAHP